MSIKATGSAVWSGGIKDGSGTISTQSGALTKHPYGFGSRFEGKTGTNPEELIGAAHAGCFTMALSKILGEANLKAESLETSAEVILEKKETGFEITTINLQLTGRVPGADSETFKRLAEQAKKGCPVSKLLKAEVTLSTKLIS
jgi:osmotically inducible protein OsmC